MSGIRWSSEFWRPRGPVQPSDTTPTDTREPSIVHGGFRDCHMARAYPPCCLFQVARELCTGTRTVSRTYEYGVQRAADATSCAPSPSIVSSSTSGDTAMLAMLPYQAARQDPRIRGSFLLPRKLILLGQVVARWVPLGAPRWDDPSPERDGTGFCWTNKPTDEDQAGKAGGRSILGDRRFSRPFAAHKRGWE